MTGSHSVLIETSLWDAPCSVLLGIPGGTQNVYNGYVQLENRPVLCSSDKPLCGSKATERWWLKPKNNSTCAKTNFCLRCHICPSPHDPFIKNQINILKVWKCHNRISRSTMLGFSYAMKLFRFHFPRVFIRTCLVWREQTYTNDVLGDFYGPAKNATKRQFHWQCAQTELSHIF